MTVLVSIMATSVDTNYNTTTPKNHLIDCFIQGWRASKSLLLHAPTFFVAGGVRCIIKSYWSQSAFSL